MYLWLFITISYLRWQTSESGMGLCKVTKIFFRWNYCWKKHFPSGAFLHLQAERIEDHSTGALFQQIIILTDGTDLEQNISATHPN